MSVEKLPIGLILRAHGLRGVVRVRVHGDALAGLERVWVGDRQLDVEQAQPERHDILLKLAGIDDRDAAEALRGAEISAARDQLPALSQDELYVADLIGCRVVDAAGRELGEVAASFDSGAHEILVVRGAAREFMLPFVEAMVTRVDLAGRLIECNPPEGLLDLEDATPAPRTKGRP